MHVRPPKITQNRSLACVVFCLLSILATTGCFNIHLFLDGPRAAPTPLPSQEPEGASKTEGVKPTACHTHERLAVGQVSEAA